MQQSYLPTPQALKTLPEPYLLFMGDITEPGYGKTAFGLRDWVPERCIGEFGCEGVTVSAGLPWMTPAEAAARGARSMVIGVANAGGVIADAWVGPIVQAMEAGLDIISGMHMRMGEIERLRDSATTLGRSLIDVREPPPKIQIATGRPRSGKRLLTVGTDCALGKKYTALALAKAFTQRGVDADFRASGQTGILLAGRGIPMDAVVSDFAAGAAEMLSPDAADDHWDVIEGQGSLSHPAYAAVSLALLHGSQPDVVVVCHQPGRAHVLGNPNYALPSIEETIALALQLGKRTQPAIRCAGVSFNTSHLGEEEAITLMAEASQRLGLPVCDPIRGGSAFAFLVDSCLA